MASSSRPYQRDDKKHYKINNAFLQPKDMVRHDILEGERKERYKLWITFFRRNPIRLIQSYFGVVLHPYEMIWIWILQRSNLAYIVASRASGKTWIIALWAITLAVLYPGTKVVVASKTIKQAGLVIEKIEDFVNDYPNIAREISKTTTNPNSYECEFHCGSSIVCVPSSENARGRRSQFLIAEESRLIPREILEQVLKPMLATRIPPYRLKKEYRDDPDLKEEGIISYITSAWYKSEYWYTYVRSCIKRMVQGDETANFLACDYLATTYHGIKTEAMIKNEMADNDALTVQMEYLNIPSGTSGKSFYKLNHFPRVLHKAFYPQRSETYNAKKNPYEIKKLEGELRFVSVDVATRSGKANDLTIINATRAIPMIGKGYERQLLYIESFKGINTLTQAKRIKEVFFDFEADFLVLDLQNAGIGVYDALSQVTSSEERGIDFPAMTVVGEEYDFIDDKVRKELVDRTLGLGAIQVIFPISASQQSNSVMASSLRNSLQKKLWKFLIPEQEAEEWLMKNNKEFVADINDSATVAHFLNPYVGSGLMIGEAINLDMDLVNGLVKLTEKSGNYKDRYSSLLYLNSIISKFDKSLLKENQVTDDWEVLQSVTFFG
jgi:hypothetical protein